MAARTDSNSDHEKDVGAHDVHHPHTVDNEKHGLGDAVVEEVAADGHAVAYDGHGHALLQLDEAAERRLRWKIDLHIMPLICLMYLWCFIDRANIGNARLYRLEPDLGMSGYDYNIILTSFFVAYVVFEYPCNILCKVVGPGKWLPFLTFAFGLISLLTSLVQNFGGLIAARFFLGMTESGLLPGIAYYLSRWYRRDELVFRLSMYIAMAPLAGAFGGLLAYGIVNDIDNIGSLRSWRMLFWVEGLVTVGVGILCWFLLTDRPETARWLSHEEKSLAQVRIKSESVGVTHHLEAITKATVWSGVNSPVAWMLGGILLFNSMTVQGIAVFLPTIVRAQYPGIAAVQQNLRTVPPYIVGLAWVLIMSFSSWKARQRGIFVLMTFPFCVLGFILFMAGRSPNVQYAGAFFVAMGSFPFGALGFAWMAANHSPDAARASSIGLGAFMQNIGGLISSWLYLPKDAPRYYPGHGVNLAGATLQIIITLILLAYLKWENKQRAAGKRDHRLEGKTPEQIALLGHRHPQFLMRY